MSWGWARDPSPPQFSIFPGFQVLSAGDWLPVMLGLPAHLPHQPTGPARDPGPPGPTGQNFIFHFFHSKHDFRVPRVTRGHPAHPGPNWSKIFFAWFDAQSHGCTLGTSPASRSGRWEKLLHFEQRWDTTDILKTQRFKIMKRSVFKLSLLCFGSESGVGLILKKICREFENVWFF